MSHIGKKSKKLEEGAAHVLHCHKTPKDEALALPVTDKHANDANRESYVRAKSKGKIVRNFFMKTACWASFSARRSVF